MTKEKARFVGFRLHQKHTAIIRKFAKKFRISDAAVVRRALEAYQPKA